MDKNEFSDRFKSLENKKLLKIIEESEHYEPMAVAAAKLELANRKVSADEIQSLQDELNDEKAKIAERHAIFKQVENKAKVLGAELLDTVNPIQKEPQTISRKINLIVIVFGLLALYQIIESFNMFRFLFWDDLVGWDFSMVEFFVPLVLLPVAILLFWNRNRVGWILLSVLFVYHVISALGMLLLTWKWKSSTVEAVGRGVSDLDALIPEPNPMSYVLIAAFFGASLWGIFEEELRRVFRVGRMVAMVTIAIAALVTIAITAWAFSSPEW